MLNPKIMEVVQKHDDEVRASTLDAVLDLDRVGIALDAAFDLQADPALVAGFVRLLREGIDA